MEEVKAIQDDVLDKNLKSKERLNYDADIALCTEFETAAAKIQGGCEQDLTPNELDSDTIFLKVTSEDNNDAYSDEELFRIRSNTAFMASFFTSQIFFR